MGLLDDLLGGGSGNASGNAVPQGNLTKPLILAVLALLASGALTRKSAPDAAPTGPGGAPAPSASDNPLGDLLGGLLGGGRSPQAGGAPANNPLGDLLGGLLGGGAPKSAPGGGAPGNNPLGDLLGGLLGGGAPKSAPGGGAPAGGALAGGLLGGLGSLLNQFQQNGQGDVIDSWISGGQNRQISPSQLGSALDPDMLRHLSEQSGLEQGDLLSQLSQALPGLIDQLTPQGRLPSADEFSFEELSRLSERLR